jgi:hypothetical protein
MSVYSSFVKPRNDNLAGPHTERLVWARDDSALFDFADEVGRLMLVAPVSDESEIIDHVAWEAAKPTRWWLHTGTAMVTSPWLYTYAANWDVPVRLVATPAEWIIDPGRRSCILQPTIVDLWSALQGLPIRIDADLDAYLRAEMTRQRNARIHFERPFDA